MAVYSTQLRPQHQHLFSDKMPPNYQNILEHVFLGQQPPEYGYCGKGSIFTSINRI